MELFQVLWDLGIAPINMILALAGLVMLFGHLYKPFTHKPTLVTRILLIKIGGKH